MSFAATLGLVLFSFYALTSVLLSVAVAVAWRAGLGRTIESSSGLLAMRLLPAGGAALLVLTVVLPVFLAYEPRQESEAVGPLIVALALLASLILGDAVRRGSRAWIAARRLLQSIAPAGRWRAAGAGEVEIVDIAAPIVAIVGGWQPRIIAAQRVVAACTREEFRQIVAHETAHLSVRDNLKLLLMVASPDALAWAPQGAALEKRWRAAAEFAADERAAGSDRRKRIELASAIIKVARISSAVDRPLTALGMAAALDDVEGRVQRLLAPAPAAGRTDGLKRLALCALSIPLAALPLYAPIHRCIEALVACGH